MLRDARLVSNIDPENHAFRRIAEKTGLTLERVVWKCNKKACVYAIGGNAPNTKNNPAQ